MLVLYRTFPFVKNSRGYLKKPNVPTSRKTSRSRPLNVSVSSRSRQSVGRSRSRSRLGLKVKRLGLGPQGLVYIPDGHGQGHVTKYVILYPLFFQHHLRTESSNFTPRLPQRSI